MRKTKLVCTLGPSSNSYDMIKAEREKELRALFADDATAYIDAHNAAYGCFAARIERDAT